MCVKLVMMDAFTEREMIRNEGPILSIISFIFRRLRQRRASSKADDQESVTSRNVNSLKVDRDSQERSLLTAKLVNQLSTLKSSMTHN